MRVSINNSCLKQILAVALTSFCYFSINIEQALSGGSDTQQSVTTGEPTIVNPVVQNASSLSSSPTTLQQIGTNNFANLNTSNPPNCGGLCVYANMTSASSDVNQGLSASQTQVSVGVMWQITSPDQTRLETERRFYDAQIAKQSDDQTDVWMQKMLDALKNNNIQSARGWAILLAPKLGKTPEKLLSEVMQSSH